MINELDIFYSNKWKDVSDEVKIVRRQNSEGHFIYTIRLKYDTIKYCKNVDVDVVDVPALLAVIPKRYSRDVYNYCLYEIAHLQGTTTDDIEFNFAYEFDLEEELIEDLEDDDLYEFINDAY